MAEHTILIADADTALCQRIEAALAPYAVRCVTMTDANDVLSHPLIPSLIVLCIDPKRLGWAICMRIKKHPVLKGVPMIITSAEATEKDFDEHKKLKTRAEEYEHKPLQIQRLVDKVQALLGGLEVQVSGEFEIPTSVEELSADDAVEIEEPSDQSRATQASERLGSDTDAAFTSIAEPGMAAGPEPAPPMAMAMSAAMPMAAPMATEDVQRQPEPSPAAEPARAHDEPAVEPARERIEPARERIEPARERIEPARERIEPARERIEPAEAASRPERHDALHEHGHSAEDEIALLRQERDRLLHDIEALKARSVVGGSASASRELLGLREVINRKDKEILDLKDAIDARDRDSLGARDRLRESERAHRDLDERLLSVEKELIGAQEKCEALANDKELGHERERGLKGRLDDAHHKIQRAEAEIAEWKARHQSDVEAAARAAEAMQAAHVAQQAKLVEAHGEESAAARREKEEQAAAHAAQVAQLGEAHRKALAEQHDAAVAERARDLATAETERGELTARLGAEKESALGELAGRHKEELAALERSHADARKELGDRLAAETAERQRQGSDASELREELAQKEQRLAALEDEILKAYHRIKSDETIVARARKALAIALTLLDDSLPKGDDPKTS